MPEAEQRHAPRSSPLRLKQLPLVGLVVVGLVAGVLMRSEKPTDAGVSVRCAPTVPSIGGGAFHALLLDGQGGVRAAGDNYFGQLGDNTRTSRATPVAVPGLAGMTAVASSASGEHSVALKNDGTVWTWGMNSRGQLGNGELDPGGARPSTPTKVPGISEVVSVAAGADHSMALTESGTVWAWGRNDLGQLGNASTSDSPVPVQVEGLTDVAAISAGAWHSLAVRRNGEVWAWGDNSDGQLGFGGIDYLPHVTPARVNGVSGATAVAAGGMHSLALLGNGTLYGWGYNDVGSAGPGYTSGDVTAPTPVAGLSAVTAIAAGYYHSLALKSDGTVWSWGYSNRGQLGNGWYGSWTGTAMQVSGISGARAVAAPGNMSLVVRSDGAVLSWGDNSQGQLGLGDVNDRTQPNQVQGVSQAKAAAPTKVAAVPGEKLALLTWEAPTAAITQYLVTPYRNGVAEAPLETTLPKLEFAVPNLASGDTYRFEVRAQNCLGEGTASAQSNPVVPVDVQTDETGFSIEGWQLNDRHEARVNISNGNLKVNADDMEIKGTAMPFVVTRSYNSRATTSSSVFGKSWTSTLGADVRLQALPTGSVFFYGPGGSKLGFAKDGTTFVSPAGINSTLTQDAAGAYTLKNNVTNDRLEFSPTGQLARDVDQNGSAHTYVYGADGRLAKVTDTQNRDVLLTYDAGGRIESIRDAAARVWRYQYDAAGNLATYTDPAGGVTRYAYDAAGRLTRLETPGDAGGPRIIELTYDAAGRLVKLAYPRQLAAATTCSGGSARSTTCFDYQAKQTVVTDANGNLTTYHVDPVGRTTKVVDALGNTTSNAYTSNSNVKQRSVGASTTSYSYSPGNAPAGVQFGTGSGYTLDYGDGAHPFQPSRITDPQGHHTTLTYDANGNVATQTDDLASENRVTVGRDPQGRPLRTDDPRGNVTTFAYDGRGNLATIKPPAPLGAVGVTYDALSRVDTVTDGKGQVTDYDYDALDRVVKTTFGDGSTIRYEYDGDGNLVKSTDALGTVTMAYDQRNNLVSRTTADGVTVAYGYDGIGNLASLTDPAGTVRYSYNAANLLSAVIERDGDAIAVSYDKDYNRNAVRYPNGVTVFSTYDTAKRLSKISAVDAHMSPLSSFEYSYRDPGSGQDTELRHSVKDKDGNVTAYAYDELNRLVRATTTAPGGAMTAEYRYAYDGAGNRTQQTVFDGTQTRTTTYAYNTANQLVAVDGVGDRTYDGNGNLRTSPAGEDHAYNAKDQATTMRTPTSAPVEMRYHGAGQSERVSLGGGAGIPLVSFTNTVLGVSQRRLAPGVDESFVRDDTGQLLSQTTAAGTYYVLTDGLGSTTGVTGQDGTLVGSFRYGPFGEPLQTSGTAEVVPFRFAGAYLDPTGLYKMGERYYDPGTARFTQQDPLHDPLDPKQWNRYAYVGGDPVNYADPTGLAWYDPSTWTKEGSKEWLSCMAKQYVGMATPFGSLGIGTMSGGLVLGRLSAATATMAAPLMSTSGKVMFAEASRGLMTVAKVLRYAGVVAILVGAYFQFSPCFYMG